MLKQGPISQFDTEWVTFSNFAYSPFEYKCTIYPTAEHAFQCAKVTNSKNWAKVLSAKTPGEAKILGNIYKDHKSWGEVKVSIMTEILEAKFSSNRYLADLLISTDGRHIEESNNWGDTYWGTVNGTGENHLGKILMEVREKLISKELKVIDDNPVSEIISANQTVKVKLNNPYNENKK